MLKCDNMASFVYVFDCIYFCLVIIIIMICFSHYQLASLEK